MENLPPSFHDTNLTINWKNRLQSEMPFIVSHIEKTRAKDICDIGGGIGMHSYYLQEQGFNILLVDPDEESLKMAKNIGVKNTFQSDFMNFHKLCNKFDFIFSLGNAFSNVQKHELNDFAKICYNALNDTGQFFVQILNYEALQKRNNFILASRFEQAKHHLRFIEPCNKDKMEMHYIISNHDNGEINISRHYFTTHYQDEIQRAGTKAGFSDVIFYSDYKGSDYSKTDGRDLIFVWVK